jgi:apolipoprotein N-acyltransferase
VPLPLLQIPGGPELFILGLIFVIGLVVFVAGLAATYWVYSDAKQRGNDNAVLWGLLTLLGFFIGLVPGALVVVIYLVVGRE